MSAAVASPSVNVQDSYARHLLQNLYRQLLSQQFCDVELKIGNNGFPAHKTVLCAASPYFNAMFTTSMKEADQREVIIHQTDVKVFRSLLDFIYTGELEASEENCQDVLVAANMFQLTGAVEICCTFLKQQLHPSNCLGIYQFSETQSCLGLSTTSLSYIHSHFTDVIKEEEFSELPLELLIQLLQSEHLQIENEFQVFTAAMNWILCDVFKRRRYVFDVLGPIRIPIISPKQLDKYIEECPDLSLKIALRKFVQDFKKNRYVSGDNMKWIQIKPYLLVPRKCARKNIFVIGGYSREEGGRWSDSESLGTVECFNTFHEYWQSLPSLEYTRSGHGVCVLNGLIYAIGGESEALIYDNIECFDPATNNWTMKASMTVPRCGLGVCVVDGEIYALGGWVGSDIGNTVEKYNPEADKWSEIDTVPTVRFAMGVTEYQGKIFLLGGMSELGTEMRITESYTPCYKEWRVLSTMSVARAYVAVTVLEGHIYAIGGWNEEDGALSTVERYSIEENKWTSVPSMNYSRAGASVACVNGLIYVIGGRATPGSEFNAPPTLKTVECYDPQNESWFEIGSVPTGRCEAGAAVV